MRILVCVKQVLDPDATPRLGADGRSLRIPEEAVYRLNRYDELAVEEALLIKEANPRTVVDAVSAGPVRAVDAVRRAMGMGADRGFRLAADEPADPFTVAGRLAAFAAAESYDLILCGAVSEDEMRGVVGPALAAALSLPCATAIVAAQIDAAGGKVEVERELEGGRRERLALPLPCLLTVQSGINRPRYPILSHLLRAHRTEIPGWDDGRFVAPRPRQILARLSYPQRTRAGVVFDGTRAENAARLLALLQEKGVL